MEDVDETILGKIAKARFTHIDQNPNRAYALEVELSLSDGTAVMDYTTDPSSIVGTLRDAKVEQSSELVGKPIQATIVSNGLVNWRILTEVL